MKNCCLFLMICFTVLHAKEEEDEIFQSLTVTNHTIELDSGSVDYMALTGHCPIFDDDEKTADLFFIAYMKEDEEDRPITFVFPGGPGGAGTIESIMTFGPRRLLTASEGRVLNPPYTLIDNPETLLEHSDLVFVDPVNCGFSKSTEEANLSHFYSVEGDIETLGEFVTTFIDLLERWNSPIYLAGISYGTIRSSGLASHLCQYGIAVKGIILDGCALDFSTLVQNRDNALSDCLIIPTFVATAWHHKRLWPDQPIEEVLEYARRFIYDEYAPFMMQPSRLSPIEKREFEKKLAYLIGLPLETVQRYNGRINEATYTAEFFRSERKVLGGLDTRYTGDIFTIDPSESHDPSYRDSYLGILPAFNHYLQKELDTKFPFTPYVSYNHAHWDFETFDTFGAPNFIQRVRRALVLNPTLKVFVGSGYYDCRTPFAATEYCFDHLDLPTTYRNNLHFAYYEAGHGFIFDHASLKKWKRDLTLFYAH